LHAFFWVIPRRLNFIWMSLCLGKIISQCQRLWTNLAEFMEDNSWQIICVRDLLSSVQSVSCLTILQHIIWRYIVFIYQIKDNWMCYLRRLLRYVPRLPFCIAYLKTLAVTTVGNIPGTRWPGRLNFARCRLTSMGPECLICFTSLRVLRISMWLLDCWELFSLVTKTLQNPAQQRSVTSQKTRIFGNSAGRTSHLAQDYKFE
jgi:hypothetical protein